MRKRIEEVFGWTKGAAGFRKTHHRGLARVGWMFTLTATAYNHSPAQANGACGIAMLGICQDMGIPTKIDARFCVPSPYWTTCEGVSHDGSTFCSAVTEFFRTLLRRSSAND